MFASGKTAAVSGGAPDAQFNYVTMLLHGDGTNGAQNNTFLDSSTNNFTITRNGNTTQGSFSPYGSNWSNYFDGSADTLKTASSSAFAMSGDFTMECWAFPLVQTQNYPLLFHFDSSSTAIQYDHDDAPNKFSFVVNDVRIAPSATQSPNAWYHIAGVRSGSTCTLYINGVSVATMTNSASLATSAVYIGGNEAISSQLAYLGYISNIRIVKGTAVYTSNFTPSTTPLTAISGTSLLTCQSNRFIDNSTNNFSLTTTGTPSVQRFNPFGASTAYSTSVIGGSGYFDGNDYLNTPSTSQFTASGDFTVSCWFYLQSFSNSYYVVGGNWDAGTSDEWLIQIQNNGAIRFLTSAGTSFSSSGVVKLNEWTYFTATRSGTTVTVKLNGTTVSTYTKSDTLGAASKTIYIGQQSGNNWPFNGYISDFRLLSGSAITTIPTAPVSSTSTGLLLSFTNGAIFDNAMMNDLETVGNAQISTSVKKYGTGSLAFDGTGDYLTTPNSPNLNFGSGDFTIELWLYSTVGTSNESVVNKGYNNAGNLSYLLFLDSNTLGFFASSNGTSFDIASNVSMGTATQNTWVHFAASRSGSSIRLFRNGTLINTVTSSATIYTGTTNLYIGSSDSGGLNFNGYIDDLRITKGYARYTTTFTPPTKALSDTGP